MATAVLSRNGTTVEFPLVESAGSPVVSTSYGKPNLKIQEAGHQQPRHIDQWSGLESYSLLGRFLSDSAYSDAIQLADLIKSNGNGNDLTLTLQGLDEYDTSMVVAPAAGQDVALALAYNPGRRDWVDVDLGLTRVNRTLGGSDQPASTPTASGSGPITLSYGGTSVELSRGITVQRSVGRPNDTVRKSQSQHPNYYQRYATTFESFELSFEFGGSGVLSEVQDLVEVFSQQLGRDALELSFNGLYGLGTFDVVPDGSTALRSVRRSGEEGVVVVPQVALRRVLVD